MSRSITTLTWGLCLVTGLALVQPALAHPKSLPAIGSAVGQVTSFEVTSADPVTGVPLTAVQTAVVMGRGSVLGHHVNQVTVFLDFVTGQASGSFEITSDQSRALPRYRLYPIRQMSYLAGVPIAPQTQMD